MDGFLLILLICLIFLHLNLKILLFQIFLFFIPLDDRFKIFHDKVSEHKEYVYPLLFLSLSTVTNYNYLNSNNYYGRMQTIKLHRSNLFDEAYHTFSDKSKSFIKNCNCY